ncbi:MAG: hypothetical protein QF454_06230 [Candidatus Thalassarchaeaceae archaeon]|jgi:hypothetical protein|nr:hypothetical protein [Candidatus Thalassarchaeaceae archaeon]
MVTSIDIKKVSNRDKVVVDLDVWMDNPDDHDFSPRASLSGNSLEMRDANDTDILATIDLDDDALQMAERDRVVEARIKFSVHGMHGTLTHKTPNPRTGPKSKKLAEPRWKVMLPLQ